MWQTWLGTIFGLWLIVAPWALGYSSSLSATWNSVILGVLVGALSLLGQKKSEQRGQSVGS